MIGNFQNLWKLHIQDKPQVWFLNISHIMSLLLKFKNKRLDHRNGYVFFKIKKNRIHEAPSQYTDENAANKSVSSKVTFRKGENKGFLRTANMERICASSIDKLSMEIQQVERIWPQLAIQSHINKEHDKNNSVGMYKIRIHLSFSL